MADKRKHKEKYNNNNTIDIMHNEKQYELSVQCSMYAVVGWFVYSVDYHRYAVKQTSQSFNEWKRRTTQMNQKDKRHTHKYDDERMNERKKQMLKHKHTIWAKLLRRNSFYTAFACQFFTYQSNTNDQKKKCTAHFCLYG